ncbi:MAG: lipoyl(octanoyl) transferase LipB [Candidatus Dormibacteraeota bacterium]|nr:lipoyl(octanoyl) transferase LipB [Candidatus Dormibacteraeota bacterium]
MPVLRSYWLGRVAYGTCWDLQRSLVEEVRERRQPDTFLLLEHPHVFTMGRRGQADHLIWSEEECARRGVEVVWSDRGGDATYHGPGQLVGYGILDLERLGADILEYVHGLETSLIGYLASLGITSEPGGPGLTGVWSHMGGPQGPLEKVAAIGCKLDHSITSHGFALNLTTDLGIFNEGIVPCGLPGKRATSVQSLVGAEITVEDAARSYLPFLSRTLGLELAWGEASELAALPPPSQKPEVGPRLRVL